MVSYIPSKILPAFDIFDCLYIFFDKKDWFIILTLHYIELLYFYFSMNYYINYSKTDTKEVIK